MSDLINYFSGAFAPVFDSTFPAWRDNVEIVLLFLGSNVILCLCTLWVLLNCVKSAFTAFINAIARGARNDI